MFQDPCNNGEALYSGSASTALVAMAEYQRWNKSTYTYNWNTVKSGLFDSGNIYSAAMLVGSITCFLGSSLHKGKYTIYKRICKCKGL